MDEEWAIDEASGTYSSPSFEAQQRLIFNESFRDGEISAEITIVEAKRRDDGRESSKNGSVIFRYQDPENYYYAGIGGFKGRFFIGLIFSGQPQILAASGRDGSITNGTPYRIRLRCVGNRFTLSDNGVTQLSVFDDTYRSGPWGLDSWNSKVKFRNVAVKAVKPTCFVIMPFAPEFDEVYQVIREKVEKNGYECVRADQRYLSGSIIEDVLDQVERADLIIADFTGKNANVFYEAGYAKALRKPVVQIAQSVSDLPFDVRRLRTFSYNTKILGDRNLARDLSEAIKAATGFDPTSQPNGHSLT